MRTIIGRIAHWYRGLPEKKKYVEFVTAVLSVPVMLTVIIINLNNLNQQKNAPQKADTGKVTPIQIVITGEKTAPSQVQAVPTDALSPTPKNCIKEVGVVSIVSPRENEVIAKDPVCIGLATQSTYCAVTWSYRLDGGDWSEYTDADVCLHNLTNGNRTVQFKIKSTVSDDEVTLQRTFVYQGNSFPTTQPTQASSSASL